MAFCTKCGGRVSSGESFCVSCGASVAASRGQNEPMQAYAEPDYSGDFAADAAANKVYGILAYLGILVAISIFAAPKSSRFARFHANQGLVLFIAIVAAEVAVSVLSGIGATVSMGALGFGASIAVAGIFLLVQTLVGAVGLVLIIIGIVNACKQQLKPLPLIGKINILR